MPSGTPSSRKRPVTAATAITIAKIASGGAGSIFTTPSIRMPSATARS